ncbi:histone-lysine N-methyltransferase SUVR5 isoform X2 [Momordica charantia]|uniref:Histone-lysine N-methyltransferase SUVR5 isoform X2 n=1 Tax=Momordica charantia TaxID=3673 RepID=A0A6J1BTN5_MOMCH|nr:histone-lysine N-methyltransferase SUVR5 isoform X2 [Momordica charantia]
MEVLPMSDVQHVEDSDSPKISGTALFYDGQQSNNSIDREQAAQTANGGLNDLSVNVEDAQINSKCDSQAAPQYLPASGHSSSDSYSNYQMNDQKASCGSPESDFDDTNTENYSTESCLASENSRIVVDTIEDELPSNSKAEELSVSGPEPMWLEGDESVALWVKWRGKWQAGIRCARADWPLSTLKAKPTHDRKKYFVVFFPHTRNYSWADALLVRSIEEFPQPIAYKSHKAGLKLVEDVKVARRFIMKKLAVGMLNIIDQFHLEALIESARDVMTWKEFAMEASRCNGYSDLGRMLLKLQNMIVQCFMNSDWLQNSLNSWVQRCQNAQTAEIIEMLKEELADAILWKEVNSHGDAPVQPTFSSVWKTWKHEVTKWFSISPILPIIRDKEQRSVEAFLATTLQVSRKRPKLEIRRAEAHASLVESKCSGGVQTGNLQLASCKDVELMPHTDVVAEKPFNSGNRNRQCIAFIESKGRQCVRWANEGDVYCCVHLSSRFTGNSDKKEQTRSVESPMCQGTTVLGSRCKHRSLFGSSFCKKHRPRSETKSESNSLENKLIEKQQDIYSVEAIGYKEIKFADVGNTLGVDNGDVTNNGNSSSDKLEHRGKESIATEVRHCIGSCIDSNPCLESPKRHSLYCEKHLPSWLKRARNGKSRVISKEVFMDLLRDSSSQELKIHLHQACELFYRLFKSILSLRNPVPMEVQFQWALSEASKTFGVGEQFMKLVCREKERLKRIWGFDAEEAQLSSYSMEVPTSGNCNDDMGIRCKICSEEFLDDQALSTHFMDGHKKEAQWLFRGYACAICLDSFTNKKVLETHVQERHHAPFVEQCMLLQCIPCGSHFGNTEQLWLHVVAVHPVDFRLSNSTQQHNSSAGEDSPVKPEQCNIVSQENDKKNVGGLRKFICRFCGLKFDLLPDLGRHHQAAHMGPGLVNSRPAKRGLHYYAYKLKSGKLGHPRFKKTLAGASNRNRNRTKASMKKHIQASKLRSTGSINLQPHVPQLASSRKLTQGSTVAKALVSEIQKRKLSPINIDILSIARSACCKVNFKVLLEQKFGVLPEYIYLKAAELCREKGEVNWHIKGFVCPEGCETFEDPLLLPHLMPHPNGFGDHENACSPDPVSCKWEARRCGYVIGSHLSSQQVKENVIILCEDISFGQELVPVVCVADEGRRNSPDIPIANSDDQNARYFMPWENFTYIKKPLLDKSLAIHTESLQFGCACPQSLCSSETCDHVYLFNSDYEDPKDIYGNPMRRRFPYDENGRIILEEGYLVYECNERCSCSRTCPNRVLQNGVQVKLEVFMTETKGWAVRAGEPILRGTFVCEYIGEVLDEQEANRRRDRYNTEGNCYFLDVDAHINDISRLVEGSARYIIDATNYGNVSRFINHSCSPNLVTYQVLVESMEYQCSHIGLYASRDIATGEELTFNYRREQLPGGNLCGCESSSC